MHIEIIPIFQGQFFYGIAWKSGSDILYNSGARKTRTQVIDSLIEIGKEYDYLDIQYGEMEQKIKLTESELPFR